MFCPACKGELELQDDSKRADGMQPPWYSYVCQRCNWNVGWARTPELAALVVERKLTDIERRTITDHFITAEQAQRAADMLGGIVTGNVLSDEDYRDITLLRKWVRQIIARDAQAQADLIKALEIQRANGTKLDHILALVKEANQTIRQPASNYFETDEPPDDPHSGTNAYGEEPSSPSSPARLEIRSCCQ